MFYAVDRKSYFMICTVPVTAIFAVGYYTRINVLGD